LHFIAKRIPFLRSTAENPQIVAPPRWNLFHSHHGRRHLARVMLENTPSMGQGSPWLRQNPGDGTSVEAAKPELPESWYCLRVGTTCRLIGSRNIARQAITLSVLTLSLRHGMFLAFYDPEAESNAQGRGNPVPLTFRPQSAKW